INKLTLISFRPGNISSRLDRSTTPLADFFQNAVKKTAPIHHRSRSVNLRFNGLKVESRINALIPGTVLSTKISETRSLRLPGVPPAMGDAFSLRGGLPVRLKTLPNPQVSQVAPRCKLRKNLS